MPKNNNQTFKKSEVRSKSQVRKPLRDVSNAEKYSSKCTGIKVAKPYKEEEKGAKVGDENGALVRLLFVYSDISSQMAILAKQCVDDDPFLRPDMKQVVISLSQIHLSSVEWEATLAGNSQVGSGLVQGR